MTDSDKKEFSETINISSNIKANKRTIIGKFDLKDIFFIFIATIIGICLLTFFIVFLSIRNMFIITIVVALFEIPILTVGFVSIHDILVLDYIKLKSKSDNRPYRKQILKKKSKVEKYVLTICIGDVGARATRPYSSGELCEPSKEKATCLQSKGELCEPRLKRLEQVMNELYKTIKYRNLEIKILLNKLFLTIEVESLTEVIYDKLFDYFRVNNDIKYISSNDINNYETYIKSLKFPNKIYGKKQNKEISDLKSRLLKLKKIDEINPRYEYLTNKIVDIKDNEFIKVYKFKLYKASLDLRIFDELKGICSITIHTINNSDKLVDLSFVNTFIDITDTRARITRPYSRSEHLAHSRRELCEHEEKDYEIKNYKKSKNFIVVSCSINKYVQPNFCCQKE